MLRHVNDLTIVNCIFMAERNYVDSLNCTGYQKWFVGRTGLPIHTRLQMALNLVLDEVFPRSQSLVLLTYISLN